MNIAFNIPDELLNDRATKPFVLYRDHVRPLLESRRSGLNAMYAPVMGRPELDPVFLIGVTLLQMMERMPDRQAIRACLFDLRWRLALGLPSDWKGFDPSTLVYFRERLAKHGGSKRVLEAGLEAMRAAGYLRPRGAVRIDSTHVLAKLSHLSRLECVRETLRLALEFLVEFGGASAWEPWFTRYADRNPKELRNASVERVRSSMDQAGLDAQDVLAQAQKLGDAVTQAESMTLLRRVFKDNFTVTEDGGVIQTEAQPSGAVHNPHDPEAQWSTKRATGKAGWVGYKTQVCETVPETRCAKGEPTSALITAIVTQPAITSDHGSLAPVTEAHLLNGQDAPDIVHTDAGYISGPELARAEKEGFELCGPAPAPPHSGDRFGTDSFLVNLQARTAVCPAGITSCACSKITESKDGRTYFYFAWAEVNCTACPLRNLCLSKKKKQARRSIQVGEFHEYSQARRNLCKTPEYQKRMQKRSAIEGTNSELKRGYGLGRSRYRGLKKTDLQMQFTAAACNIHRWANRLCWLSRKAA